MAGAVFKSSDLLADLGRIVKLHTRNYREDFDLDKKLLTELCASATPEDHHVIWMSRVNGTHCLREREIFLTDSYENHVWHFYHEQLHDSVLAYALTLTGMENGKIKADIFPLDYQMSLRNMVRCTGTSRNRLACRTGGAYQTQLSESSDPHSLSAQSNLSPSQAKAVFRRRASAHSYNG